VQYHGRHIEALAQLVRRPTISSCNASQLTSVLVRILSADITSCYRSTCDTLMCALGTTDGQMQMYLRASHNLW